MDSNCKSSNDVKPPVFIAEGMIFQSWNDFAVVFEEYINSSKSPMFVIGHSKTVSNFNKQTTAPLPLHLGYQSVTLKCAHNGKYKSQSTGARPLQRTEKIECPAKITVRYNRLEKGFEIKSFSSSHCGHPVDEHTFKMYSINRGLRAVDYLIPRVHLDSHSNVLISKEKVQSNATKSNFQLLVKYKAPVQTLKQYLKDTSGVEISTKGVHNIKQKLKGKEEMPSYEKFLELLLQDASSDKGMILETMTNNDTVQLVYFQFSWMINFFAQYPDHILMDGTYCLNDHRMPLYIIMAVDGNNRSIPVAFGLLAQETKPVVESFVKFFVKHNPSCKNIKSYMTDKDFTEISVLRNLFPQAKHELCLFHVLKSFKEMVHSSNVPKSLYGECKDLLQKMAYATSEETYDACFEKFKTDFSKFNIFEQFVKRWHFCRQSWSNCYRMSTYNLGDVTNNRLESFNQKLKQNIKRYAALGDFYVCLKMYLSSMFDKLAIAAFKDSTHKNNFFTDIPPEILERVSSCGTYFVYKLITSQISEGLGSHSEFAHNADLGHYTVKLPKHRVAQTTLRSCSCSFFAMINLPCCHIFALRYHLKQDVFTEDLVPQRWTKSHYLCTINACRSSSNETTTVRKLSKNTTHSAETDKYLEGSLVCKSILEILKTSSRSQYDDRLKILQNLINEWSKDTLNFKKPFQIQPTYQNFVPVTQPDQQCNGSKDIICLDIVPNYLPPTHASFPDIVRIKRNKQTAIGQKRRAPKPSERLPKRKYRITDYFPRKEKVAKQTSFKTTECDQDWLQIGKVQLKLNHNNILLSNAWLDSDIIHAASCLLKEEYTVVEGLQHTTLQLFKPPRYQPCYGQFVQICHVAGNHWNCISGKVVDNALVVDVYDSLYSNVQPEVVSVASSLNRAYGHVTTINFKIHNVDLQPNSYDCGLFAIAFAKLICAGKDPSKVIFEYNKMRAHLLNTFINASHLTEFPARYDRIIPISAIEKSFEKVYCFCRKTGDLKDLILCKKCKDYFHKKCLSQKNSILYSIPKLNQLHEIICERCEVSVIVVD